MKSKSCCNRWPRPRAISAVHRGVWIAVLLVTSCAGLAKPARAADAPQWLHALVNAPLPPHDERADAVLLYAEDILNVQSDGKIKSIERRAYKILRPDGREHGMVRASFDSETRITGLHGWCIPAQGKDYEVKDKDVLETALFGVLNGELATDERSKLMTIPAADPGNIIGYEIEQERRPYILQDLWDFQQQDPVRQAIYTLQLPPGWEYKASFLNYPEVKPSSESGNQLQWVVNNVAGIRPEDDMPPWTAVAGVMIVSFFPPGGGPTKGFGDWNDMALWQAGLDRGRRDSSPGIKQKVAELTASETNVTQKMATLAKFVQNDIRYVGIQLGIGGWQPHPAADIFSHRFGDCKDKVTLLSTMLKEIGVDSYYVAVNTERGAVNEQTPATRWFDHMILAIKLPEGADLTDLQAVYVDKTIGKLLIFDPTDDLIPFGYLPGQLQANYGLLVTDAGGELIKLPKLGAALNGIRRSANFTLTADGTLTGDVKELRLGDRAAGQRYALRTVSTNQDRIKPIENLLSGSLSNYRITHAAVDNLNETGQPFGYEYSVVVEKYAKTAGNLLLVRPRVLGTKSSALLETKDPRKFPVEFDGPLMDSDDFEIKLPAGYVVDDLPPAVDVDYEFASYHSKTVADGNTLKYTRWIEVKQLTVPVEQTENLRKFYRIIASDERNTAVIRPAGN